MTTQLVTQLVMGGLMIATGLVALAVGCVMAGHALRDARRAYLRTASLSTATLESWSSWFLDGFSGVTMGIRWLFAIGLWLGWTVIGICLIGVGIRVLT